MADYSDVAEFAREDAEGQLQDAKMFVAAITNLIEEKGETRTG
jgi:uncharacterized protein (UPF0332 family)